MTRRDSSESRGRVRVESRVLEVRDSSQVTSHKNATRVATRVESRVNTSASDDDDDNFRSSTFQTEHNESNVSADVGETSLLLPERMEHSESNDILDDILSTWNQEEKLKPDVDRKIASFANAVHSKALDYNTLKEKLAKYNRPKNCGQLLVPKINVEIWNSSALILIE